MASLTSILAVRLLDQVSGPAAKVGASVQRLQGTVTRASAATGIATRAGNAAALATTRVLAAAGGVAGVAVGVKSAIGSFAELERQMNRVGITAGAGIGEVKAATVDVSKVADEAGVPLEQVVSGLEALVAAGRTLPEAMGFLPAVVRTAHAAGAETSDIASTADALATSFKIAGGEMQRAFDVLVEGGNLGKFELRDMARYLPSLAANAAAIGLQGEEGVRKLVAMLQVMRKQMGTSEEAATSMNNVFAKMESEETAKKFAKFGVDLRKEMAVARREGKDLLDVFLDLSNKALKGDLSKVPQLFSDMEFARGMRALLAQRAEIGRINGLLKNSGGAVAGALERVSGDTTANLDRLMNRFEQFGRDIGDLAASPVISMLNGVVQDIRAVKGEIDDFDKWVQDKTGYSVGDIIRGGMKMAGIATPEEQKAANDRREAERANPDLGRAREAQEEVTALDRKIEGAKADVERAEASERKSPLSKGRADQARKALEKLQLQRGERELAARALAEPLPGPVEIPIDADAGRASFHAYRTRREAIEAAKAEAAREGAKVPMPAPDPRRAAPVDIVPVAPYDDPTPPAPAPAPAVGQSVKADADAGAAALGGLSTKAGEAKAALDQVAGTRVAPAVDTGSLDAAIAKAQQLKSAILEINGSSVRIQTSPALGQSLRGIHADIGIE
ncbi:Uncharacterised protein [Starkeya nomas]|uniref:Phage tail tape measure protein domain-containing protein n=1 Tax=Starkeya nomas TaxID=2666134 RepID=A0A5S9P0T7_9HYPH|nr:phage tail tape measure protein [Starkeya nomas]CAA0096855.1 Uncharacterised protein [Starkeya nomas]